MVWPKRPKRPKRPTKTTPIGTLSSAGYWPKVINKLEIDRTAIDPITRLPILFGSSLKGAVRTALLDQINNGDKARPNEKSQGLQQRLFDYQQCFEQDPMRLVQFADAPWVDEAGLPATQIHLAVNRKKAPVMDAKGQLRASAAELLLG